MASMFDDGIDEYEEQQVNTPTVRTSVPTAAPQQKSAEQEEIEKILAAVRGIKESHSEVRKSISDIEEMAGKAEKLTVTLSNDIKEIKPLWDKLLKSYTSEVLISDESFAQFNKVMKSLVDQILVSTCSCINKTITENVTGQFTEVANRHIQEFDDKVKAIEESHKQTVASIKKDYNDNVASLEKKQGKLLAQAIEEKNRILMPSVSFWTIILIFASIALCGIAGWFKFWQTPDNDETMTWMVGALIAEFAYYGTMIYTHFAYKDEQKTKTDKKKNENEPRIYSISLSEAIYIIFLTLSASVYFMWAQLNISYSPKLLIYLLPVAWASNFLWLMLRGLLYGIFQKD